MIIVMLMCSSITLGITIFLLLENKVLVSDIEFYFDSSYKITLQLNSGFRWALSLSVPTEMRRANLVMTNPSASTGSQEAPL